MVPVPAGVAGLEQALHGEVDGAHGVVGLVHRMILDALSRQASDIHIELRADCHRVVVRLRCDGQLEPWIQWPAALGPPVVARIKVMACLDVAERRRPQDGRIRLERPLVPQQLDLRVATIPTQDGLEDVVIRLLASAAPVALEDLAMDPLALARFRQAIGKSQGLILCAGPTGSGKTTTLHAALALLNTPHRKIWTAEDPVEIVHPGLRQVQINPRIEWTFERALRSILRADPDVIMVGEIRDRETAQTAVEAALTGHLVLSTIHANSAAQTITRLIDIGIDPFRFSDSLLAVLGQRLVRRLCPHCRQVREVTARQANPRTMPSRPSERTKSSAPPLRVWEAIGCAECGQRGTRGRVGLHELLVVTGELRALVQKRAPASQIQACAVAQGMVTLERDGMAKVAEGLTTLQQVLACGLD